MRPHGVKGELRLRLFNKSSDILLEQDEVLVRMADGEEHEVSIDHARRADDAILLKLFSVDDRDRADDLRGAHICVRRKEFPAPGEGEFYAVDIVGSEARMKEDGTRLGEVVEIMTYPTVQSIIIRADDKLGDWEVPLSDTFIGTVDTAAKVVEILTLEDLERTPLKKPKVRKPRRGKHAEGGAAADGTAADGSAAADGAESADGSDASDPEG